MAALALADIEVRFPGLERPALSIPKLCLSSGEHVALTGPSGSGKTTLINLLTGLERPQRGRIAWDDVDIARLPEGGRDRWRGCTVGLVMQDFHLIPGLTVLGNVLLPQKLAHLRLPSGMMDDAKRLLQRVGIERLDQPVETLSRGQMQRVALARALVAQPTVIIADEPTASLDAASGELVGGLLTELAAAIGATLLVATHDTGLLRRFSRVLRLESGMLSSESEAAC